MESPNAPDLTIVVPTFREAASLPHLIDRVARLRDQNGLGIELLVVDDNSRDGTEGVLAARSEPWVRLIVRTEERGLSGAVLRGLDEARGEILVVMDADLSHPPEVVPQMLRALDSGSDFVVGSRYVDGGSIAGGWGWLRRLNSYGATLLARPFTKVRDPMSGFFALRRETYGRARSLNPIGYKIGLELMVKCDCKAVSEVPIHFEERRFGESKLSFNEQLKYLQHIRRLACFKFGVWAELGHFLLVGGLGTIVNLVVLTLLLWFGLGQRAAIATAIVVAMSFNFVLNRRFSFSHAREGSIVKQYFGFVATCSVGALVNYRTSLFILGLYENIPTQIAALAGIAVGTTFNFCLSRLLVFRRARPVSSNSEATSSLSHGLRVRE